MTGRPKFFKKVRKSVPFECPDCGEVISYDDAYCKACGFALGTREG